MVIRQTNSKGDFVETLLEVLAFGNIVSLLTYSIATSAATAIIYQEGLNLQRIISPIVLNLIVFIIGGLFGVFMYLFFSQKHSTDKPFDRRHRVSLLFLRNLFNHEHFSAVGLHVHGYCFRQFDER